MSDSDGIFDGTFRYDRMVENALKGVLREALTYVAENGLPGQHHFYITFLTRHPGVEIPDHLLGRYPDDITIVLQHQFWGLNVGEDFFEVTLSFSGMNERLRVPFDAVTAFADPSAKFGLQFQVEPAEAPPPTDEKETAEPVAPKESEPREPSAEDDGEGKEEGAEVITLDAFRKK